MFKTNIANLVTLSRIFIIPILMSLFLQNKLYLTIILFTLAAFTDGVDGYLARCLNQTSPLGAWLDPVADKLIVISMLVLLLAAQHIKPAALVIIMICREIIISALREWMATLGKHHAVKVSHLGKWKTSLQMLAIFLFLLSELYPDQNMISKAAYYVLYLATFFTLISLIDYLLSAFQAIQKEADNIESHI